MRDNKERERWGANEQNQTTDRNTRNRRTQTKESVAIDRAEQQRHRFSPSRSCFIWVWSGRPCLGQTGQKTLFARALWRCLVWPPYYPFCLPAPCRPLGRFVCISCLLSLVVPILCQSTRAPIKHSQWWRRAIITPNGGVWVSRQKAHKQAPPRVLPPRFRSFCIMNATPY